MANSTRALSGRVENHPELLNWESDFSAEQLRQLKKRISRFVYNAHDAEDILQESLLITIEKFRREEIRNTSRLADFVVGVARNLLRQEIKRRHREPTGANENLECKADYSSDDPIQLLGPMIAKLPVQRDRDVLSLYFIRGIPLSSIARCQSIDESHIYRVVSRAKNRLVRTVSII